MEDGAAEAFNKTLNDPTVLESYKKEHDSYRPALLPRLLGGFLVWCGNAVYGKGPSYLKFRAIEVIARVPYHSWESAAYTLLTIFYQDEAKAMRLSKLSRFARVAKDNETMHVVVISKLAREEDEKAGMFLHTAVPLLFAFFYFWAAYWLYLMKARWAFEMNYMFEDHAFEQYDVFIRERGDMLKAKSVQSEYLAWYGREVTNQYEFFRSLRNDELMHRNASIEEIRKREWKR